MPTCDVLLRRFRKMLLYTQGYAVAYSHLLSTFGYSDNYEATEIAVNGDVEINGRAQRVKNSIIGCATVLANFCMRD